MTPYCITEFCDLGRNKRSRPLIPTIFVTKSEKVRIKRSRAPQLRARAVTRLKIVEPFRQEFLMTNKNLFWPRSELLPILSSHKESYEKYLSASKSRYDTLVSTGVIIPLNPKLDLLDHCQDKPPPWFSGICGLGKRALRGCETSHDPTYNRNRCIHCTCINVVCPHVRMKISFCDF